jgi:signal transduction histidine kinase
MDTWRVDPVPEPPTGFPPEIACHGEVARFGVAGLSLRLTALQRKLERDHALSVALDISDRDAADSLSPDVTAAVHAIFFEAASNAARHSCGMMVRLTLQVSGNSVSLRIEDDGVGFAFKGIYELRELVAFGVGSQTLARLVAIFGGRMRLDSRTTGTRIEIGLPRDGFGRDVPAPPLPDLAIAS